jgi:hypothetical protein
MQAYETKAFLEIFQVKQWKKIFCTKTDSEKLVW